DPIKTVVSGNAVAALAIDFYAFSRINKIGANKLGFAIPKKQTVISSDPIAILRGAPNRKAAARFIEFILRTDIQQRLFLPKGADNGPVFSYLGRIAVNPESYKNLKSDAYLNPHKFKSSDLITLDQEVASRAVVVRKDLVGAIHVDTHRELRKAWQVAVAKGDAKLLKELATPPLNEQEFVQLTTKWGDGVFRNRKINAWVDTARKKYQRVIATATQKN
ncbi:MAG: extracellular solute-binding protein, partial [Pseudomonadota bacterium]|nr:extracellular solute-binding protein [Pseudomonadota bacterium]